MQDRFKAIEAELVEFAEAAGEGEAMRRSIDGWRRYAATRNKAYAEEVESRIRASYPRYPQVAKTKAGRLLLGAAPWRIYAIPVPDVVAGVAADIGREMEGATKGGLWPPVQSDEARHLFRTAMWLIVDGRLTAEDRQDLARVARDIEHAARVEVRSRLRRTKVSVQ